jgi:hypothetical protein
MQEEECQQRLHLAEHKDRKIIITGRGGVRSKRNHQILQEVHLKIPGTIGTITQIVHGTTTQPDLVMILHRDPEEVVQHVKARPRVQAQTVEREVEIN